LKNLSAPYRPKNTVPQFVFMQSCMLGKLKFIKRVMLLTYAT